MLIFSSLYPSKQLIMAGETKKSEIPVCACGRVDLYDEWLKQNEMEENMSTSILVDKPVSSSDNLNDMEPVQKQPLNESFK